MGCIKRIYRPKHLKLNDGAIAGNKDMKRISKNLGRIADLRYIADIASF